jgi:hypothetical protein
MKTPTDILRLALPLVCGALFTGCLTMPEENDDANLARLAVEIAPAPTAKTAALRLREMTVTLVSDAGDTLRDTITDAGSRLSTFPARLNAPDGFQIIHPVYALDPAKSWSVSVKTFDGRDSVVHAGSVRAGTLTVGALRNVRMNLRARFAGYEAVIALPAEAVQRGDRIGRVEATVDGATSCTTETLGADSAKLTCDDLPVGRRAVTLSVYGSSVQAPATRLLYKGAADVDIAGGDASAQTLALAPADETPGDVGIAIRLAPVGQVIMKVILPEGI